MPTRLRVLTNSELKTSRRCAREHQLAYELGYRSVTAAHALRFGNLIHAGLEAWWRAVGRLRLTAALATLSLDLDPYDLARATVMLEGYTDRWSAEAEWFEVLDVEAEFRAPLINPETGEASRVYQLGGKIDVLVLDRRDQQVYIVEHKTSGDDLSTGADYWQVLRLDTQISTYYQGARGLGYAPAGVIYDVLAKSKHAPLLATPFDKRTYRKDGGLHASQRLEDETPDAFADRLRLVVAEDPERFYQRGQVVRLEAEETDARWDTWLQSAIILGNRAVKRWPRNPESCRRYGRLCSFFGVCTGSESLDDPERFRHVGNVHEELSEDFGAEKVKPVARTTH